MQQKVEIVNSHYELAQASISERNHSLEKLGDMLQAVLQETDIRIAELKKDAFEFKRDVVIGAENMRTGKTSAEKMMKYMEERLRQHDRLLGKTQLKNATMKTQIKKCEAQLRQKDDLGEVFHYVDFHQLQIENRQNQTQVERKNAELLQLKLIAGEVIVLLNLLKMQLHKAAKFAASTQREIMYRSERLSKLCTEHQRTVIEIRYEHCESRRLVLHTEDKLLSTCDYIVSKVSVSKARSILQFWQRKVEVASMLTKMSEMHNETHVATAESSTWTTKPIDAC
mmetsp:Transcript_9363/g.28648  ORF Transcript_9363/g.28648 Transcript_9363/m.28648 type:complete len:283 (+) Transcript_9363:399-1247(+)